MEMERINEDVIKVFINMDDLEERGIDMIDLISDQRRVEKFFYSILEEVDVDRTFYESDAITFQVIPSSDGIELYISRSNIDDMDHFFNQEIMRRMRERKEQINDKSPHSASEEKIDDKLENIIRTASMNKDDDLAYSSGVVRFLDIEDFIRFAREERDSDVKGDLYMMLDHYFFVFNEDDKIQSDQVDYAYGRMLEFGNAYPTTINVLEEYGQLLRQGDAISYFGYNL